MTTAQRHARRLAHTERVVNARVREFKEVKFIEHITTQQRQNAANHGIIKCCPHCSKKTPGRPKVGRGCCNCKKRPTVKLRQENKLRIMEELHND